MVSYKKYVVEKLTYMSGVRVALLFSSLALAFAFIICLGASAAWSREYSPRAATNENGFLDFKAFSLKSQSPPPVLTDQCLPLLKSVQLSSNSVSGPNQRPAGTAAALGLLMGMRYALSPAPQAKDLQNQASSEMAELVPPSSTDQASDRSALAVLAYRQCQKEQALQNLQSSLWPR